MGWAALIALASLVPLAVIGVIVYSFTLRRHGEVGRPQDGWFPTDEVFSDPSTGRRMRVWIDPSGSRHYVEELMTGRPGTHSGHTAADPATPGEPDPS